MEINEKELVSKASQGDVLAFEELVCRYQKKVYNIAYRMLGNPDDASEMAQEAFVKAYLSIGRFRGDSSLTTWLYRITVNVCTDFLRRNKKSSKVISLDEKIKYGDGELERQIEGNMPDPSETVEKKQLKELMDTAISQLSDDYRKVIILRDFQNLSYKEIADILGCAEGTIKSRINRARKALKDNIIKKWELFDEYVVKYGRRGGAQ